MTKKGLSESIVLFCVVLFLSRLHTPSVEPNAEPELTTLRSDLSGDQESITTN